MQRVLVIGMRRQNLQILQKHFAGRYSIDALDDQANHAKKITNADKYSTIISCTKFTNHSTERLYSKHKGFTRIAGGRSSVKNFLEAEKQLAFRC